jgi:long-chain acyl-CoA synthetase
MTMELSQQQDQLDDVLKVRESFKNKHVLITGTTGFVGKVLLSMIAVRCPEVRMVSVLVRTNSRNATAKLRFDNDVMTSEPFKAISKQVGESRFKRWCAEKILPIAGDVTLDHLGISSEDYTYITKTNPLDLIIHCAGNVNFDPPLNQALEVNTLGVAHKLELAKAANCPLIHMSTCFVAGARSGKIYEDEEVVGYSPSGAKFDVEREVSESLQLIDSIKARAKEQVMELKFRDEAELELSKSGLNEESEAHLTSALKEKRRR